MDEFEAVRAALDRGDWRLALELLAQTERDPVCAEGLELRARAAYGNGDFEASVAALEELHALLVAEGDMPRAAMAAAMAAMYLMMDTGLMAPVRGWLRRAERLVAGHDEAPARAVIAMTRAYERFMCGDMQAAAVNAELAIDLGTRFGVGPAVVIGRVCSARVTILEGHVAEGLDLLDEIGVELMSGAADPLTTGMMYCELICAAQGMALHDRSSEWTEVMDRWRHDAAIGGISGRCRVHRAEILKMSGPCDLAEAEALAACDELRPWMRREFGWPLVELGNIRLRRGDLAGAEEAFLAAHEHAWSPFPGLALLRLAQGDVDSAAKMIGEAIAHPLDIPSKERPPFGDLRLAPLYDAQAEIAAAAGDVDTTRWAADQLGSIADAYPSRSLQAGSALARARAALVGGDHEEALREAAAATVSWAEIGAPFEAAAARMVLGEARQRSGDPQGARMEWRAARSAFETFGARRWAEQAERCAEQVERSIAELPVAAATPQPARVGISGAPAATFRCDGDTRTMCFGELTVLMHDLKGFRYIERLLGSPGREFHVLDLVALERSSVPIGRTTHELVADRAQPGLAAIDDQAREAYRRRLAEVDDDIADAQEMNDLGRIELAQRDREYLVAELARAVGLGGRSRTVGGSSERARSSVTRSLRYALRRLSEQHPAMSAHLGQSVHTGTYCAYTPDSLAPVVWHL